MTRETFLKRLLEIKDNADLRAALEKAGPHDYKEADQILQDCFVPAEATTLEDDAFKNQAMPFVTAYLFYAIDGIRVFEIIFNKPSIITKSSIALSCCGGLHIFSAGDTIKSIFESNIYKELKDYGLKFLIPEYGKLYKQLLDIYNEDGTKK